MSWFFYLRNLSSFSVAAKFPPLSLSKNRKTMIVFCSKLIWIIKYFDCIYNVWAQAFIQLLLVQLFIIDKSLSQKKNQALKIYGSRTRYIWREDRPGPAFSSLKTQQLCYIQGVSMNMEIKCRLISKLYYYVVNILVVS